MAKNRGEYKVQAKSGLARQRHQLCQGRFSEVELSNADNKAEIRE